MSKATKRRPNWMRPTDYPGASDLSLDGWAWQFLIRNPKFNAEIRVAMGEQDRLKSAGELMPLGWSRTPTGAVLKRWGVKHPILPSWPGFGAAPVRFDSAPRFANFARIDGNAVRFFAARDDRIVLEFDLDAPIDPQIERARRTLLDNQRQRFPSFQRRKNQRAKFPLYLRLLDATADGASVAKIADTLSEQMVDGFDESTARKALARASELRDQSYRDLMNR